MTALFGQKNEKNFFALRYAMPPFSDPVRPVTPGFGRGVHFPARPRKAPGTGPQEARRAKNGGRCPAALRPLPRCLAAAVPPRGCAFRRAGGARCPGRLPCPGDVRAGILQGMGGRTPETGNRPPGAPGERQHPPRPVGRVFLQTGASAPGNGPQGPVMVPPEDLPEKIRVIPCRPPPAAPGAKSPGGSSDGIAAEQNKRPARPSRTPAGASFCCSRGFGRTDRRARLPGSWELLRRHSGPLPPAAAAVCPPGFPGVLCPPLPPAGSASRCRLPGFRCHGKNVCSVRTKTPDFGYFCTYCTYKISCIGLFMMI